MTANTITEQEVQLGERLKLLRLNQNLHDQFKGDAADLWQLEPKYVFDTWWAPLQAAGHGTASFEFSRLARGVMVVNLQGSIVVAALEGADQLICHYYAGLFAGALSFFERAERHAMELQCLAVGHGSCTFVVGPGADIDVAETARQQGDAPAEVIRRLG